MEFENRNDVKEEEYIEMIRLKTSVLLACATSTGSVLVRLHFRLADGVTESALTVTDAVLAAADETESLASAAATLTVAGGTVRRG